MSINARNLRNAALFALGFGLCASQMNAQASFTLPVEAHWGTAVLKPGEYTLSGPSISDGVQRFDVHSDKGAVVAVAIPAEIDVQPGQSDLNALTLVEINHKYFVQEYACGQIGEKFTFQTPKIHEEFVAKSKKSLIAVTRVALH